MENKKEKMVIPVKNYIILLIIFIITIIATIYINAWIKTYKANSDFSPLTNLVQEITLSDLEATMPETNIAILYIADNSDFNLDNDILKMVNDEAINDYFYYLNVEKISNNQSVEILKNYFNNLKDEINKIPMFIYIKDGKATKVFDSNERQLTINDLSILINNYLEIDK